MKKVLLLAAFGVAGIMSAKYSSTNLKIKLNFNEFMEFKFLNVPSPPKDLAIVTSDCGEGGPWLIWGNDDGSAIDYEQIDDMRQELNETFCD